MAALRWFHVISASIVLFAAPLAMAMLKGGAAHRRFGKIYFWCMLAVAGSAFTLSLFRFNP